MLYEDQLLIIRRNDFLDQLSEADYESLNIEHNFLLADKNTYFYFDDRAHDKLYFIKEGFVRIGYVDDDGNEFIKEVLQPGDVFGQLSLTQESLPGEYAQAHKKDTILCAFCVDDFKKLLERKPALAVFYAQKVGEKLRKVENRLLNLLQRDVRTRLLYFFWTLLSQKQEDKQQIEIPNYLTHEDIARLTGTSRQTVTTIINQLAEEGHLKVDRKAIVVYDLQWLRKEAKIG